MAWEVYTLGYIGLVQLQFLSSMWNSIQPFSMSHGRLRLLSAPQSLMCSGLGHKSSHVNSTREMQCTQSGERKGEVCLLTFLSFQLNSRSPRTLPRVVPRLLQDHSNLPPWEEASRELSSWNYHSACSWRCHHVVHPNTWHTSHASPLTHKNEMATNTSWHRVPLWGNKISSWWWSLKHDNRLDKPLLEEVKSENW